MSCGLCFMEFDDAVRTTVCPHPELIGTYANPETEMGKIAQKLPIGILAFPAIPAEAWQLALDRANKTADLVVGGDLGASWNWDRGGYGQGLTQIVIDAQHENNGILNATLSVLKSVRRLDGRPIEGCVHPYFVEDTFFPNLRNLRGFARSRDMKHFRHPFRRV